MAASIKCCGRPFRWSLGGLCPPSQKPGGLGDIPPQPKSQKKKEVQGKLKPGDGVYPNDVNRQGGARNGVFRPTGSRGYPRLQNWGNGRLLWWAGGSSCGLGKTNVPNECEEHSFLNVFYPVLLFIQLFACAITKGIVQTLCASG